MESFTFKDLNENQKRLLVSEILNNLEIKIKQNGSTNIYEALDKSGTVTEKDTVNVIYTFSAAGYELIRFLKFAKDIHLEIININFDSEVK